MNVWTLAEAARILKVSPDWYREQLKASKLPGHKIARKWRITQSDLDATLEIFESPAIAPEAKSWGQTKRSQRLNSR